MTTDPDATNQPTSRSLAQQSTGSRMIYPQAASSSELMTAIHSPHDPGKTLKRVNAVLSLYFDPDFDMETKAAARDEFVRALAPYPDWAVQRAFDVWARTMARRPSPGEIVILVSREMKPLTDEVARREKMAADHRADEAAKDRVSPEAAAKIMAAAGFTPKRMEALAKAPMARTMAEAEAKRDAPAPPHWTETATEADLEQLQAARACNPIIQAARAAQQAKADAATSKAVTAAASKDDGNG